VTLPREVAVSDYPGLLARYPSIPSRFGPPKDDMSLFSSTAVLMRVVRGLPVIRLCVKRKGSTVHDRVHVLNDAGDSLVGFTLGGHTIMVPGHLPESVMLTLPGSRLSSLMDLSGILLSPRSHILAVRHVRDETFITMVSELKMSRDPA
jgi:hypothetical protein